MLSIQALPAEHPAPQRPRSRSAPAGDEVHDKHDDGNHKDNVDQAASDMKAEPESPKND